MIVYHGSHIGKLDPTKAINSRYGMTALFFTDSHILADMYRSDKGILYQAEIHPDKIIDFGSELSHSRRFRNLIHKLHKEGHGAVMIENVYDRPNSAYHLEKAIIMVVFDFDKIQNLRHAFN